MMREEKCFRIGAPKRRFIGIFFTRNTRSSSGSLERRKTIQTRTTRVISLRALIFACLGRKAVFQLTVARNEPLERLRGAKLKTRRNTLIYVAFAERRDVARRERVSGVVNILGTPVLREAQDKIIHCLVISLPFPSFIIWKFMALRKRSSVFQQTTDHIFFLLITCSSSPSNEE